MVGPIRRENQRRRTSKHARKKRNFLVLTKLRELKEKGASVSKAIRQLQGEPVVQLQRMDDSAMHNRQEHRNYHSVYQQRGWKSFGRRRELDDVWMPNYDDDDFDDPNARWNDYAECSREMFRYEYPEYPRNRLNSHPNQYYNQYELQNYTYSTGYSKYTWHAGNKNPIRGRPQSQRGRIPTVTSTVTSEPSREPRTRILVDCDRNKRTIEEAPSPSGETVQRLSCNNKQVVPEKSDISEIVPPSSVKDATASSKEPDTLIQPDEPCAEGNSNTSLNTRLLPSLDPLCNPEFNVIVANLENCIASSADVTRKAETETFKDGNGDTTGVVEIEVVIASYPEEATMLTDDIGDSREVSMDSVDSDAETVVYCEESVVYDNEVTIDNINTASTFLNYKEPIQMAVDTSPCQSSNISIKRKSEDSSGSKIKISKSGDNEKTESIINVNDKLSTDTIVKSFQVTHPKVLSDSSNDNKESSRHSEVKHQQKGTTVVDGMVNSKKPQGIVRKCKITKRRKTVHNTLPEQAESNHSFPKNNDREKRCKSEESDKRNICKSEESDTLLIRITRSKGHEFGLDCGSLPAKFREHSKPTKSKHPRSTGMTQNSQSCKAPKKRRYRIIRDSSSDEESDRSSVSYNSSASEKRRKRPKKTSKPKVPAAISAKAVDLKLQKAQLSASSHIKSSQPIYNNASDQISLHKNVSTLDKKRNLVRLNEYQRTESVERSSNIKSPLSQMDILFGPHSDNEEITIRWSPKPENLIWSPQLDDSDSPDCIFRFDKDAVNGSSISTSKSYKEKTEENIQKKVPWDHGLRTVCAHSDDKKESKKTHHRVSLVHREECSKKIDSRRASLSHNVTEKQESEKSINEQRRFSLGHDKDLIVEKRYSLTPITNILPLNDKITANKDDSKTLSGVSGNHANNIQNNQHRRSSVTQNNSENKGEQKNISNHNGIIKQNVTKIEDRRSSSSHTSTTDVKQDKKTLPVSINNVKETNNEQKKPVLQKSLSVENKKENKRPTIKQRQLSIDLKHATMNHLQGLTWESIIHLECVHPELKSARHCQQQRKVKPNDVVLMPVVTVYDKFMTIKRPRRTVTDDVDSQPGSSAEPNIGSSRDVIDLCDSDDEQIRDINSINSLMRTVLDKKPIIGSNVTCSDAAAPSNEEALKRKATTSAEIGIQHSAVGASGVNVTLTEIPVTIQCSTAMPSTSSSVPPIVMKQNRNKTPTEYSAVRTSGVNVTPTEIPVTIQCSTAMPSTSSTVPPIVMKQKPNKIPTELDIPHSAVGASHVNVTPTEIPVTIQCSTAMPSTSSSVPPIVMKQNRNKTPTEYSAVRASGVNVTPTKIPVTIQCSTAMPSTSSSVPPIVMKQNPNKIPTELDIPHSAVGASRVNVTPTEIPVTIQCSTAMPSTSSSVPPIVMKQNRNKTPTEYSAVRASGVNVTPTEIPVTIQCSTAMPSTSSSVPPIVMKQNRNKIPTELDIPHSAVGASRLNVTPTEIPVTIQCSTAMASTSSSVPPIVMIENRNKTPTEYSAVRASRVNVTPTNIPVTIQCSTTMVPTSSGLFPTVIEQTRNNGASTNVQNTQQDMPHLSITLINPRSAANASNVPMLCGRNSTTTITPISTSNIPVIQATTNSISEIQASAQAPSTFFTSAPNVASASCSTFNTRQVENVAPMLYNIERSIPAMQAATTAAISSSNISMAQVQCMRVTVPTLIQNEDFANTWGVPILLYNLMEQSINQLLSYYSSQYKISREDIAKEFRFVVSSVSQSRTDLAGRLLSYLKTHEITNFNLKEMVCHICTCCMAKYNYRTPPIGILKILVEITNEWNLLNSNGFLMTFARTVLLEWRNQYTAVIKRQTAANMQKTRRASATQNHNQTGQQGVQPQASTHMTTSAVESNQRQNSNQNLMSSLQKICFFRQCQEYRRLLNEPITLRRQQQRNQLLANTPAQNIQQQCRRRGSVDVQRQSVDASNIPGDGLRRQAQQRPMVSGIQPPIAHASFQASSVPQNQHSALQQLQQQVNSVSNQSVVPETPVRANVSWIPNQNVAPAANASPSFAPSLPLTQPLRSLLRQQTVPSGQATQPPLMQPQTTRTFNPFPNDEFRIKLPLSQPLESTIAPHSITAASTWTPPAQVCDSSAAIANPASSATIGDSTAALANQASCATVGDCINATIVKALEATGEAAVKDEMSEDIIDVDEWFEKMNDEVVCLNPEYFSQVHIKYDIDQLIKADVTVDSLADNTGNIEAQQQDPNPPRIASVDSGFSSPPRQFEHPEILSGERMCICSKRAEMVCKCRLAIYCSKQCQLVDWPNHQPQCVRALSNLSADHCM